MPKWENDILVQETWQNDPIAEDLDNEELAWLSNEIKGLTLEEI